MLQKGLAMTAALELHTRWVDGLLVFKLYKFWIGWVTEMLSSDHGARTRMSFLYFEDFKKIKEFGFF